MSSRRFIRLVALLAFPLRLEAEAPALDYLFPAGGQIGTTNTITIGGKFEPWPAKVWIDCSGIQFEPQTNKGAFKVSIATNAPLGPHLVRLFNPEGASAPKWIILGEQREISEVEPNDNRPTAQRIEKLPVLINGRLEKSGDVDSFALQLEAGQPLVASVDAYTIGSPIDPTLLLLDEQGNRVAFNSDGSQSCDPLLEWKATKSGTYILQVYAFAFPPAADVRFAGSAAAVYRLSITSRPFVAWMFPASVPPGQKTEVKLGMQPAALEESAPFCPPASSDAGPSFVTIPNSFGKLRVAVSDLPRDLEREPNNSAEQAQPLRWPVTFNGRIDPPGDEDRFVFDAKKGEKIEFRLRSASLGLPLDATLRIEDPSGKQVVRDDDSGDASDPLLTWAAPSNGTYRVVVADLLRRGGPEYVYALEVRAPIPDFKVSVDSSTFRIQPGKTNEIKLAVTRSAGHSNKLEVAATGLPENVSFKAAPIGGKDKEGKISLLAATNATPFNGPFQIEVTDAARKLSRRASFDLGPKESRFGDMLIGQIDHLWLTVATNAPAPEEKPKKK